MTKDEDELLRVRDEMRCALHHSEEISQSIEASIIRMREFSFKEKLMLISSQLLIMQQGIIELMDEMAEVMGDE